jgi:putative endonuclease
VVICREVFIVLLLFLFMDVTQSRVPLRGKQWVVYILECLDGSCYTGVTNDVDNRMKVHASGKGSKYVASKGFSHLIATKVCKDKSDACKAEYWVKRMPRGEKLEWFKDNNA